MKAHIIENTRVTNTIEVESLSFMPHLIDASLGGKIGDLWDGSVFSEPAPTAEDIAAMAASVRSERDALIAATDYYALTDVTMNAAMTTYRQALRDISTQAGFPNEITWPVAP